jgi:protein SCO1/2
MISIPLTIGAALLGLTGLYHATDGLQAFTAEGARRVAVAKHRPYVPDITFEDMTGTSQSLRPQSGETVLVEFIYTTCPTICQTAGGDFAQLRDALVQTRENVRMISVSFNPANDTLAALGDYAELHTASGSPWTVARVDVAQRAQVLDFFNVTVIPDEWGGFQHNTAVLLIEPDGRHTGVFDTDALAQIACAVVK